MHIKHAIATINSIHSRLPCLPFVQTGGAMSCRLQKPPRLLCVYHPSRSLSTPWETPGSAIWFCTDQKQLILWGHTCKAHVWASSERMVLFTLGLLASHTTLGCLPWCVPHGTSHSEWSLMPHSPKYGQQLQVGGGGLPLVCDHGENRREDPYLLKYMVRI